MCKKWADQAKRTGGKWDGPKDHSVLCSYHFEEHYFEADMKLAQSFGVENKKKPQLKPDAVPTLFQDQRDLLVWMLSQSQGNPVKKR